MIASVAPVLIETSAWIEALRPKGDEKIRKKVAELIADGRAAWCHIVRLELWAGANPTEIPKLEQFRNDLRDLPTSEVVWSGAYELARRSRSKGLTVPASDLLIISCARVHGVEILHRDKHFDLIEKF